jgi:hypothetical protein
LITVLAIRKSTAKRGSEVEVDSTKNAGQLLAMIAVRIADGKTEQGAAVDVDVPATRDFVKILVDQYDGFTKDVFHCLLPSMSRARSPATVLSPGPLAKQLYHQCRGGAPNFMLNK